MIGLKNGPRDVLTLPPGWKKVCGLTLCREALSRYTPSPSEQDLTINMIQRAAQKQFEHDGYLVKDVLALENGMLKQIKHKGSGGRVYVGIASPGNPCLAGFYKKGQGDERMQDKAIASARERAKRWISGRQYNQGRRR